MQANKPTLDLSCPSASCYIQPHFHPQTESNLNFLKHFHNNVTLVPGINLGSAAVAIPQLSNGIEEQRALYISGKSWIHGWKCIVKMTCLLGCVCTGKNGTYNLPPMQLQPWKQLLKLCEDRTLTSSGDWWFFLFCLQSHLLFGNNYLIADQITFPKKKSLRLPQGGGFMWLWGENEEFTKFFKLCKIMFLLSTNSELYCLPSHCQPGRFKKLVLPSVSYHTHRGWYRLQWLRFSAALHLFCACLPPLCADQPGTSAVWRIPLCSFPQLPEYRCGHGKGSVIALLLLLE